MSDEKVYQFNEYVLGYDKGLNDRSSLTISKVQNGNMYVMATLTDGSADVINMMLDNLQNEIDNLKDQVEWWKQQCDDLEMQLNNEVN